jgi:acyl-CoA synthetase (AMP-forming)/AMP-acid ligase II
MRTYEEIVADLTSPGAFFEVVEEEVLGERMQVFKDRKRSLRQLLQESAVHGDKEYLVLGDRRISYGEHLAMVASTARSLRERYGVTKGDRVAILAENHLEWVVSFWAAISLGAVVAALNGWWTEDEIRYGIDVSEPAVLIADRKRIARLRGRDPGVPTVEIESGFGDLLGHRDAALPDDPIAEDDPAVILFTSGTTGRPKGAVSSHRSICGFVHTAFASGFLRMMLDEAAGAPKADPPAQPCSLMTVPLFHLSGLYSGAVMMLAIGGKTVWRVGRFDPVEVLRLIETERVTNWAGLGSMAPRVLSHPDLEKYDLSSIRNFGSGGAPTSPALQEKMCRAAPNGASAIGLGYGLSETVTAVAMIGGRDLRQHPTSVGRPTLTHQIQIRDADGSVLPDGEQGEIHVRSPYNMLEYWRDPVATARTLRPGRWVATGDIGYLRDGRLYINSRARDMILRAAENIYPVEIEHRLEEHPAVTEAAVVGVDHPELGQEVMAVVVPVPGCDIDTAELAAWVGQKLAAFKVPVHWDIRREPLPRNAAGKVLKNVLTGEVENRFVEE